MLYRLPVLSRLTASSSSLAAESVEQCVRSTDSAWALRLAGLRRQRTAQLGDGLADALSLGLQLFQVRLELGGPLLAGSEAALEAVLLAPVVVGTAIASAAAIAAVVAAAGAVATVGVILVVTAAAPTPVFVAVALTAPAGLLALVVALTAPAAAAFALVMTLAHWCTSVAESSRVCYSPPAG